MQILIPESLQGAFRKEPGEIYIVGWLTFSDTQTTADLPNIQ